MSLLNNNKIIIHKQDGSIIYDEQIDGLQINFAGENSTLEIFEPCNFSNCNFILNNNSSIVINQSEYPIQNLFIFSLNSNRTSVIIEKNFSYNHCDIDMNGIDDLGLTIGEDCMFSFGIYIRMSDQHTIYDINTNEVLNAPQKGIKIGNHVWCGMNSIILKDVKIPDNCIIGAGSTVCATSENKQPFEQNTVIVGSPAKTTKKNINWSRKYNRDFIAEQAEKII